MSVLPLYVGRHEQCVCIAYKAIPVFWNFACHSRLLFFYNRNETRETVSPAGWISVLFFMCIKMITSSRFIRNFSYFFFLRVTFGSITFTHLLTYSTVCMCFCVWVYNLCITTSEIAQWWWNGEKNKNINIVIYTYFPRRNCFVFASSDNRKITFNNLTRHVQRSKTKTLIELLLPPFTLSLSLSLCAHHI